MLERFAPWQKYRNVSDSKRALKEAKKAIRKAGHGLPEDEMGRIAHSMESLETELSGSPRNHRELEKIRNRLLTQLDTAGIRRKKSTFRQYAESIGWAIGIALLIRFFLFEPFKIPTGSMIPSLLINDHIFVAKSAYGLKLPLSNDYVVRWSEPQRGDVVVFPFPDESHEDYGKDFIKRIIGVAGDEIQLVDNIVYVNGEPVEVTSLDDVAGCGGEGAAASCKCVLQEEQMGDHVFTSQHFQTSQAGPFKMGCPNEPTWPATLPGAMPEPFVVPDDHVFVMGDNRDNSRDGRYWGTVPVGTIRGRALFVWWADDKSRIFSGVP